VYSAGWLQEGIVGPAQLGTAGYLYETPDNLMFTAYWQLIWDGQLAEAAAHWKSSGLAQIRAETSGWLVQYPQRPDYFTHWGEAFKRGAETIGLPIGDYPHARPPQAILPEHAVAQIRAAYERAGLAGRAFAPSVAGA
jgi:4-hydroxy-tetrahydrodipicolinate synthase